MNALKIDKKTAVISSLLEGNSVRSTERMTGVHRDTICRLLVEVGDHCTTLLDERMRNLRCQYVQCDEIWTYVGKKQKRSARTILPRPATSGFLWRLMPKQNSYPCSRSASERRKPRGTSCRN